MTRAEFINDNRQKSTVLVYSFGRPSFRITAKSKHTVFGNTLSTGRFQYSLDGYTVAVRP